MQAHDYGDAKISHSLRSDFFVSQFRPTLQRSTIVHESSMPFFAYAAAGHKRTSGPASRTGDICALGYSSGRGLWTACPVLRIHAIIQIGAAGDRIITAMTRAKYTAAALCACIAALALAPADVACDFTGDVRLSSTLLSAADALVRLSYDRLSVTGVSEAPAFGADRHIAA